MDASDIKFEVLMMMKAIVKLTYCERTKLVESIFYNLLVPLQRFRPLIESEENLEH